MLRIRELLRERGITSKDLAETVGISEQSMSAIVSGQSLPRTKKLKAIADTLDVDISELFKRTKKRNLRDIFIKNDKGEYEPAGTLDLDKLGLNDKKTE